MTVIIAVVIVSDNNNNNELLLLINNYVVTQRKTNAGDRTVKWWKSSFFSLNSTRNFRILFFEHLCRKPYSFSIMSSFVSIHFPYLSAVRWFIWNSIVLRQGKMTRIGVQSNKHRWPPVWKLKMSTKWKFAPGTHRASVFGRPRLCE